MASFSERYHKRNGMSGAVTGIVVVVLIIVAALAGYFAASSTISASTTTSTSLVTTTLPAVTSTQTEVINGTVTKTLTSTTTSVSTTISTTTSTPSVTEILTGAGSTFIYPVLSAMIAQYQQGTPSVQINYQSIGSGGGISALEGKTVDFAASDAPLQAADIAKAPSALTIPATIGAVTVAYNLPGIKSNLHLTGSVVADIFLGKVTMWNDPEITALNSNVTLPAKSILVVHRSDSSGTTFTFTGYLSIVSPAWNSTVGQAKSVAWPVGLGSNGNAGVAGVVQGTSYTIGYVELAYALQNSMTVAAIQNAAGTWKLPTLSSTAAAVQGVSGLPAGNGVWSSINLLNEPGTNSYPIVTFSYIIVYQDLSVVNGQSLAKATALVNFLWWEVGNTAQTLAGSLSYVPLPANVVALDEATIKTITFNGQAISITATQ
jgi:phosphate transport system substrate-binding protein